MSGRSTLDEVLIVLALIENDRERDATQAARLCLRVAVVRTERRNVKALIPGIINRGRVCPGSAGRRQTQRDRDGSRIFECRGTGAVEMAHGEGVSPSSMGRGLEWGNAPPEIF